MAAVIGHVWPVWYGFRGGKGAATLIGTLIVLSPSIILPVLLTWLLVLGLSGFVGLSTMSAGVAAPIVIAITQLPDQQPVFIYCTVMAMYLIFSHRLNIVRMRAGTENRVTWAILFKRQS